MHTIACLSSMATRGVLAELAEEHERHTGRRVALTAIGGVDAARRVRAGEGTDVVVLASGVMQALAAEGHVLPGSLAPVAASGIAVAIRANAPQLGIGDVAALRQAVLAGGRIGYSTGASGDHLLRLFRGWGILPQIEGRLVQAQPGVPVAHLLADGAVELGFQQMSELLGQPGITVLGPLPPDAQSMTTFTAGIARASAQPDAAQALIGSLTAAAANEAKRRHGMEPGQGLAL